MSTISGIHHVTSISGAAQANLDFFTRDLGQHLIKRTVNFDDPSVYHLYYGDKAGSPGTILTYFPFEDAGPGRAGTGAASAFAYAIPKADFEALTDDLAVRGLIPVGAQERFGEKFVTLRDPDNAPVELIESAQAEDIHGVHSVTLWVTDPGPTLRLLTDVMGYQAVGQEDTKGVERHRLILPGNARGRILDVIRKDGAMPVQQGAGSIHHIAFRAKDDAEQLEWMDRLARAGYRTTEVRDRQYFNAIYFREPGGILFEIATDPPGFAVDEDPAELGCALKLPPRYEEQRARIECILPPLNLRR